MKFIDLTIHGGITLTDEARCLQSRYYKGYSGHKAETSGIAFFVDKHRTTGGQMKDAENAGTIVSRYYKGTQNFAEPHVKVKVDAEPGEQGIFVQISPELTVYAVWYEPEQCYIAIRRLTPKECFRLQGWADDYFEKAQFVNSDSQLYKQAGNGVTVSVIQAIAESMNIVEDEE